MITTARRLPYGDTVTDIRRWIARQAAADEGRFGELTAAIEHRALTPDEVREHRLLSRAATFGRAVAALLGYIEAEHGPDAAYDAAAMVDDMGRNGGAPFCDDLLTDTPETTP